MLKLNLQRVKNSIIEKIKKAKAYELQKSMDVE